MIERKDNKKKKVGLRAWWTLTGAESDWWHARLHHCQICYKWLCNKNLSVRFLKLRFGDVVKKKCYILIAKKLWI